MRKLNVFFRLAISMIFIISFLLIFHSALPANGNQEKQNPTEKDQTEKAKNEDVKIVLAKQSELNAIILKKGVRVVMNALNIFLYPRGMDETDFELYQGEWTGKYSFTYKGKFYETPINVNVSGTKDEPIVKYLNKGGNEVEILKERKGKYYMLSDKVLVDIVHMKGESIGEQLEMKVNINFNHQEFVTYFVKINKSE